MIDAIFNFFANENWRRGNRHLSLLRILLSKLTPLIKPYGELVGMRKLTENDCMCWCLKAGTHQTDVKDLAATKVDDGVGTCQLRLGKKVVLEHTAKNYSSRPTNMYILRLHQR